MKKSVSCMAASLLAATCAVAAGASEYDRYFGEIEAADVAADAAWDSCKTCKEFEARRVQLRRKMVESIGGLPARTPLNPKVCATVDRDGYRIEKVLFESRPNFHVTALAFVPSDAVHRPPYPAIVIPCGHSPHGKGNPTYQRACVMGAKEGFLMLIYDPFDQGERMQGSTDGYCCWGHNQFGAKALSVGLTTAQVRIWDGMRAIDYLVSRSDVRPDRIGCMGNSGGGTLTAYLMALDPRIRAAAPSCYISSLREVVRSIGPQDAEQCLYGQLASGVNHAALILMSEGAVRLQLSEKDFFPIAGARSTLDVVMRTASRFGLAGRYGATVVPGPHGWKESSRRSSLDWMRQWLMDDPPSARTDADYAAMDLTFDPKSADMGLPIAEAIVTENGKVLDLPGERSVYDILVDTLIGGDTPRLVFREREPARHRFYDSKSAAEELSMMCQMLGRSLVLERKAEILATARAYFDAHGVRPVLVAEDSWLRPAELAYAEAPDLFAGFRSLGDGRFHSVIRANRSVP